MCVYVQACMFIMHFWLFVFQEVVRGNNMFNTIGDCGSSMEWAEVDEMYLTSASLEVCIRVLQITATKM